MHVHVHCTSTYTCIHVHCTSTRTCIYIVHIHVHIYIHDLRPKRQNETTTQYKSQGSYLRRKNELPWVGFEPMTFRVLGRALLHVYRIYKRMCIHVQMHLFAVEWILTFLR